MKISIDVLNENLLIDGNVFNILIKNGNTNGKSVFMLPNLCVHSYS